MLNSYKFWHIFGKLTETLNLKCYCDTQLFVKMMVSAC